PITVMVTDSNNQPVTGATVVFTAPGSGPSGTFANGAQSLTVFTDDGRASAVEYHPNSISGEYQIQVRAEYLGRIAFAKVRQRNVERKSNHRFITILAVAGAAVGGAIALSGGNS